MHASIFAINYHLAFLFSFVRFYLLFLLLLCFSSSLFLTVYPLYIRPLFMATSLLFILLELMGSLPFVPNTVSTIFDFLWVSLQDCPLTCRLPGHYFYSEYACHTTLHYQTKSLVLFPLSHCIAFPKWIRVEGSLHLLLWHASSGPSLYLPLLEEMSS